MMTEKEFKVSIVQIPKFLQLSNDLAEYSGFGLGSNIKHFRDSLIKFLYQELQHKWVFGIGSFESGRVILNCVQHNHTKTVHYTELELHGVQIPEVWLKEFQKHKHLFSSETITPYDSDGNYKKISFCMKSGCSAKEIRYFNAHNELTSKEVVET